MASAASKYDYDMFVIGSGPAGHRAAIQAAKLGKLVAVAEKKSVVGGACINTGTIPSKTLREAALHLSGYRERSIYGASYTVKQDITMEDLLYRAHTVVRSEIDVSRHQLARNRVELIEAAASFDGPNSIRLSTPDDHGYREITAEKIVICGYIDAVFDGPAIAPSAPLDRAHMDQWISVFMHYAYRPLVDIVLQRVLVPAGGGTPDEDLITASVPNATKALGVLDAALEKGGYFAGGGLSLADFMVLPMIDYLPGIP